MQNKKVNMKTFIKNYMKAVVSFVLVWQLSRPVRI